MTTRGEARRSVRMAVVAALIGAACGRNQAPPPAPIAVEVVAVGGR